MWSRRARIIWFALDKENGNGFCLKYPIFCSILRELLDSFHDLASVLCLFFPTKRDDSRFSIHTAKELTQLFMQLLGAVTDSGTYDLVNAHSDHMNFRLSVKNSFTN